ncbi:Uncharacterised protein [Klebsiella pneumoniae]|nr:Uncharacterised protein [Klebsiella pneumoniae]
MLSGVGTWCSGASSTRCRPLTFSGWTRQTRISAQALTNAYSMLAPNSRISAPAASGPMQAPTPKVTSSMAVSETRRSVSTWSLEKATASG